MFHTEPTPTDRPCWQRSGQLVKAWKWRILGLRHLWQESEIFMAELWCGIGLAERINVRHVPFCAPWLTLIQAKNVRLDMCHFVHHGWLWSRLKTLGKFYLQPPTLIIIFLSSSSLATAASIFLPLAHFQSPIFTAIFLLLLWPTINDNPKQTHIYVYINLGNY